MTTLVVATSEQVSRELKTFLLSTEHFGIVGAPGKLPLSDSIKSALSTLKNVPCAKDAILQFLGSIFDKAVNEYLTALDVDQQNKLPGSQASSVIDDGEYGQYIDSIEQLLTDLVLSSKFNIWCPIILPFSLDLLGGLSTTYSQWRSVANTEGNLTERLQLWLNCKSTKCLLHLTVTCFSNLITNDSKDNVVRRDKTDQCVSTLLETSLQYSPHLDWAVAHVGSCFPCTIINRVLACGLTDFYIFHEQQLNLVVGDARHNIQANAKFQKLGSVVGILDHLFARHGKTIRAALLDIFTAAVNNYKVDKNSRLRYLATIPYLLQLLSMSQPLFTVVSVDCVNTFSDAVLVAIYELLSDWQSSIAGKGNSGLVDSDSLLRLVAHLLFKAESNTGADLVGLFLKIASIKYTGEHQEPFKHIVSYSKKILDLLIMDMQQAVCSGRTGSQPMYIAFALRTHYKSVFSPYLFTNHDTASIPNSQHYIGSLLALTALYGGEFVAVDIINHLLENSTNGTDLLMIFTVLSLVEPSMPRIVELIVRSNFKKSLPTGLFASGRFVANLLNIVVLEKNANAAVTHRVKFSSVLAGEYESLCFHLTSAHRETTASVLALLTIVEFNTKAIPVVTLCRMCDYVCRYFLYTIRSASTDAEKIESVSKVGRVVTKLLLKANNNCCLTHNHVMRYLVEKALSDEHCAMFGGRAKMSAGDERKESLVEQNVKVAQRAFAHMRQSTEFHIVGSSKVSVKFSNAFTDSDITLNRQLLMNIVSSLLDYSCFSVESRSTRLGLLLVELVSPDIMYNGFPWQEEDFARITIERDLEINSRLEAHPILWDLLELLAARKPSLCYCSVILRAVAALLMSFWATNQDRKSTDSAKELSVTNRLIRVMGDAELLPKPLSELDQIFDKIHPFEIHVLLRDVWNFMRINVPSPASYLQAAPTGIPGLLQNEEDSDLIKRDWMSSPVEIGQFTINLHKIMMNNIGLLATQYVRFFGMPRRE